MHTEFPSMLSRLRHVQLPPSVLHWLMGMLLTPGSLDTICAPGVPIATANLTHVTLSPWNDSVSDYDSYMALPSLVSLIGYHSDLEAISLSSEQVFNLSQLPRLKYLSLPVEPSARSAVPLACSRVMGLSRRS
ncbi:hypothetical protein AMAG_10452 [Allomyces macrogynus ATCC 38327]|uniref:Uncharacterized protein n=1 Tax=Allomyces macrogynus (strain ATCC 38327) TaxID=578462 RepID=A0A0L0SUL9_ALLM3|nr:hypothetical protein, variant [Allomyces macrogynus ATCC 38327]KNE66213.1 hypothetical protein AMAG_10452 [Allomyces macrogynus ATCC 38327]|eukprot:KNE66212.1 hypothetical protein, variant [Allomyces macrogynus ATCC 38327]